MRDGLYQVCTNILCAGFVIENGELTECAPILRKNFGFWKTIAKRIEPRKYKVKTRKK
jgi:hypothetical protein